METHEEKY